MVAAIQHVRRTYTTDGTTGNVSVVTGLPFVPKLCIIESTGSVARDVVATDRNVLTRCFVDTTTAMGASVGSRNTGVNKRQQASGTGSLIVVDATDSGASPEVLGTPALTAAGLDINFTTALSGRILEFYFMGGDDVTARVVEIQISDGSVTGLGLGGAPTLLWGVSPCLTQGTASDTTNCLWTMGIANATDQWVVSHDGAGSDKNAVQDQSSFLRQILGTSNTWTMSITSLDADGFSWSGSNADNAYVLAVRLATGLTFVGQVAKTADTTDGVSESLPDTLIDDLGMYEICTINRLNNGNTSAEGWRFSNGRCFAAEEQSSFSSTHLPASSTGDETVRTMSLINIVQCSRTLSIIDLKGEITAFQRIPTIRWNLNLSSGADVLLNLCAIEGVQATPVPVILSITGTPGLGRVLNGDTSVPLTGTDLAPTGVTDFHYADGKVFASATKVLQSISAVTDTSLTIDTFVTGAVGDGANYGFVRTDVGGAGEQVSAAFPLTAGLNIRQAAFDNDTLAVLRFGREVFAASDNFILASQTAVSLTATTDLTPGTRKENHKVVAGVLTVMTAPEITAADAKFPEVVVHRDQFVIDVRDPGVADDLDKKLFDGARWWNTGTSAPFGLLDNAPGAADWITEAAATEDGGAAGFIHDTDIVPVPSSPTLIPFAQRTGQTTPPNEPITNVAGTFTPKMNATMLVRAEVSFRLTTVSSSNDGRLRLALYKDVNSGAGPYTEVLYSNSWSEAHNDIRDRQIHFEIIVDMLITDTYQVYLWKDSGTATATAFAFFQRVTFLVLDTT